MIWFETTQRELQEVYDRYAIEKVKRLKKDDIILLDGATPSSSDEDEEDDEVDWFRD